MRWFWQKRLPGPMLSAGGADEQVRRNRDARLKAEAAGQEWRPRGATEAAEQVDLGGGIVIRDVQATRFLPVTPALRAVAREDFSAFRGGHARGVNVQDGPGAVERIPPASMVWAQMRVLAPRWNWRSS